MNLCDNDERRSRSFATADNPVTGYKVGDLQTTRSPLSRRDLVVLSVVDSCMRSGLVIDMLPPRTAGIVRFADDLLKEIDK